MSLPYPSMVFVPLDILTAEEMNQLVANIESLSAGTGLANGSVTSDKIDSATIIIPNTSVIKATLANQTASTGSGTVSNVLTMPETGFLVYTLTVGGTGCAAQIKQPSTDYRFAGLISTNWAQMSGIMPVKKGQRLDFLTIASSTAGASVSNLIIFGSEVA